MIGEGKRKPEESALVPVSKRSKTEVAVTSSKSKALTQTVSI